MKIPAAKIENFVLSAKEETSPMQKAWLDVEAARLLATNGHMAIRLCIEVDPEDVSGLIPIEAFELARKELKAIIKINGKDQLPDPWLKVIANEDTVFIQNLLTSTTHLVTRPKLENGAKYPVMDAVFPEITDQPTTSLSAEYVATIAKSLEGVALNFWVTSNEKCVAIASSGPAAVVLMPMRSDAEPAEVNRRGAPAQQPVTT